ncbi:unnamed protein product [Cyclocybe aegerita]|uniref:HAT C-terminal dimerisation domain-containing protein n=1 Tax=Cyclocybe aegerita TaxID=1973307 RepID=A0A8S0WC65_CYCAE|nr:unnamed protein product [Cyclocybe aegerita]
MSESCPPQAFIDIDFKPHWLVMAVPSILGLNGQLLNASKITFYHDIDDKEPLPPAVPAQSMGRGQCVKLIARFQASVRSDQFDNDGQLDAAQPKHRHKKKTKAANPDTDAEDGTFAIDLSSDAETMDSRSDVEGRLVTNTELANMLPAKTIPGGVSRKHSKRRQSSSAALSTAKKPCQRATVEDAENNEVQVVNMLTLIIITEAPPLPSHPLSLKKAGSASSVASTATHGKCNNIYLFYKEVTTATDGTTVEGNRYYRCYHGSCKVFTITPAMKHSVKNMIHHLEAHFPQMHKLWAHLEQRREPPTEIEIKITSASKELSQKDMADYLKVRELAEPISTLDDTFSKQLASTWDQGHFEELLAKWIIECDEPFDVVERPLFKELLSYVHLFSCQPLKTPGCTTICTKIMKLGEDTIEGVKSSFEALESQVLLSLDAWTSENQIVFLAIVAHYITNNGESEELLIDFKEIIGEHSGENMVSMVWETLELYGLKGKIVSLIMDNAFNNDTLVEGIASRCKQEGIPFSAQDARGCCMPHTIHLAAVLLLENIGAISIGEATRAGTSSVVYQEAAGSSAPGDDDEDPNIVDSKPLNLDTIDPIDTSAIGKLRKIVCAVRSSPQCHAAWLDKIRSHNVATRDNLKLLMLILDIQRAAELKKPLNNFVAKTCQLRPYELTDQDWTSVKMVMDWLHIFKDATQQMLDKLKTILHSLPANVPTNVKNGLVRAHQKLSDYYFKFDQSPHVCWAALLDPRISYTALAEDFANNLDLSDSLETLKTELRTYYLTNYAGRHTPSPSSTQASSHSTLGTSVSSAPITNFTAHYQCQDFNACDPIKWWYAHHLQFPNLYRLAHDILAIPGSAVAVECIFSGGCDMILIRRASLKAKTICTLMILKQHLRLAHAMPAVCRYPLFSLPPATPRTHPAIPLAPIMHAPPSLPVSDRFPMLSPPLPPPQAYPTPAPPPGGLFGHLFTPSHLQTNPYGPSIFSKLTPAASENLTA